jgi:hypothetical protein
MMEKNAAAFLNEPDCTFMHTQTRVVMQLRRKKSMVFRKEEKVRG